MKFLKIRRGNSLRTRNRKVRDVIQFFGTQVNLLETSASGKTCDRNLEIARPNNMDDFKMDDQKVNEKEDAQSEVLGTDATQVSSKSVHFVECKNGIDLTDDMFRNDSSFEYKKATLREDLRVWSLKTKIPNSSVDLFLKVLRNHGHEELPSTARTLKQTPRSTTLREMYPGKFCYLGIRTIINILEQEDVMLPPTLTINFNVDGVRLFGSSHAVYWPILGAFTELPDLRPFVIGLYFNERGAKPSDVNDYFLEFVEEVSDLINCGFNGVIFNIGNIPLDAPAYSFVTDTKGHNSRKACHKCEIKGKHISGRMCFPQVQNLVLRTDEKFRSHSDPEHHQTTSGGPLEKLPLDMIHSFKLDYLHVVLLGGVKKLLKILLNKYKLPMHSTLRSKLRKTNFDAMNQITQLAQKTKPAEIQRSIRTLNYIAVLKGKEFRTFILYYGIVSLRNNVHKDIFDNYLTLHIAITICLTKEHKHLLDVAELCFQKFVRDFKSLYGQCLVSYNIHTLLHLVEEVRRSGPLDNYSTFPYENLLGYLKSLPNSGNLPLEQGINRYVESLHLDIENFKERCSCKTKYPEFNFRKSSQEIQFVDFTLKTNNRDCWFMSKEKDIVKLVSITQNKNLMCQQITSLDDYYTRPLKSSFLNIFEGKCVFKPLAAYSILDIKSKVFAVQNTENSYVFFPLLHSYQEL